MQWVYQNTRYLFVIGWWLFLTGCGKGISSSEHRNLPKIYQGVKKMVLISSVSDSPAFYIDIDPVTYRDFKAYVEAGGTIAAYWDEATYNINDQPVTGINWYHAADYCNWRSKKEGLTPAYVPTTTPDSWGYPGWKLDPQANGYRLPSEAQFIRAARADKSEALYPWGNDFSPTLANYDDERGVKKGNWWRLAKVQELQANAWGVRGMSGNIWHWCDDWLQLNRTKMLKGGGWGSISPAFLQIDYKTFSAPSNYNFDIGFRCVLPASALQTQDTIAQKNVQHSFYQYQTSNYQQSTSIDYYNPAFAQRLAAFLGDYFPQSLYFLERVDQQPKLTPIQMAQEIIAVTKAYQVNPLFLTAIMVSESGLGSCSFPRWYNNPMAFHWQNKLMPNGLPVYNARPGWRNRKYKNLREAYHAFCKGIRRDLYFRAARENLYDFHIIYVGYESDTWLYTIARVFKDVAGIRFEADEPIQNAGKFIYLDWEQIRQGKPQVKIVQKQPKEQKQAKPKAPQPPKVKKRTLSRYFLIAGSYTSQTVAKRKMTALQKEGFDKAQMLQSAKRFRVTFGRGYQARESALVAKKALKGAYPDVWIWRK
ncbi:hypothetical protein BKI52_32095 [marine bacterium AO1-C]|nr:hypothetical protein BKI52_32095 [marine bacterium AO1-C]